MLYRAPTGIPSDPRADGGELLVDAALHGGVPAHHTGGQPEHARRADFNDQTTLKYIHEELSKTLVNAPKGAAKMIKIAVTLPADLNSNCTPERSP